MNINEASKCTGISKDMIRFYEKEGLINPKRNTENNYRDYSENDTYVLVLIKLYSSLGIELKHIKELMESQNLNAVSSYMEKSIQELQKQKVFLEQKIENANSIYSLVHSSKKYDFIEESKLYFYPSKNNDANVLPILFENYGAGIPICHIDTSTTPYTYEQGFLFHHSLQDERLLEIKLATGTYCRFTCKVRNGELIPADLLEPELQCIKDQGYTLSNDVFVYLIMGSGNIPVEYERIICMVKVN